MTALYEYPELFAWIAAFALVVVGLTALFVYLFDGRGL